jgi:hypothetical protein
MALHVFGGCGYSVEYGNECEPRGAFAITVCFGTSETQRNVIVDLRGLR